MNGYMNDLNLRFIKFIFTTIRDEILFKTVYFEQRLGGAHSKCMSKYAFSLFLCKKAEKRKNSINVMQNLAKKGF